MLLLSWCTLYIAFSNYQVSWFLIAYNLSQATPFQMNNFFFLKTFGAPLKKQQYCFFHGAPWIYHIQSRKYLKSSLLILMWHTSCQNPICKTYLFLKFGCSTKKASIFFFLCNTLYIAPYILIWKVPWYLSVDFSFSLVTQTPSVKRFYSQSSWCSATEATILIGHLEKWPESC